MPAVRVGQQRADPGLLEALPELAHGAVGALVEKQADRQGHGGTLAPRARAVKVGPDPDRPEKRCPDRAGWARNAPLVTVATGDVAP